MQVQTQFRLWSWTPPLLVDSGWNISLVNKLNNNYHLINLFCFVGFQSYHFVHFGKMYYFQNPMESEKKYWKYKCFIINITGELPSLHPPDSASRPLHTDLDSQRYDYECRNTENNSLKKWVIVNGLVHRNDCEGKKSSNFKITKSPSM